jgi:hypothetical protein
MVDTDRCDRVGLLHRMRQPTPRFRTMLKPHHRHGGGFVDRACVNAVVRLCGWRRCFRLAESSAWCDHAESSDLVAECGDVETRDSPNHDCERVVLDCPDWLVRQSTA